MTCTCGYNVAQKWDSEVEGSLIKIKSDFTNVPKDCVVIKTSYFSINFADVCLRWGLYGYSYRKSSIRSRPLIQVCSIRGRTLEASSPPIILSISSFSVILGS